MKAALGVLALLLALAGVPAVIVGVYFIVIMLVLSNASISSGGGEDTLVGMGMLAVGVELALCYAAWRLLRSETSQRNGVQYRSALPHHLCPNCGCREADGAKTCRWCGAAQDLH